jgi:HSP20 family protein
MAGAIQGILRFVWASKKSEMERMVHRDKKEVLTMANLIKWSPIWDLMDVRRDWDPFFEEEIGPFRIVEGATCECPPVESFRSNGNVVVRMDLPGVRAEDVHVGLHDGYLTIKGERKREKEFASEAVLRDEVCYGPFERNFAMPHVKAEEIKARYHEGVLEITAPLEERYTTKKIEVEVEK